MPIPLFPLRGIGIEGSQLGSLDDLKQVIALGQKGVLAPIPYCTRPLSEAEDALSDLRNGKIIGRAVLTP
jgi:D-arabinose 1-dehydrogenase-like Zn-dependent alcohol dehydrogenase